MSSIREAEGNFSAIASNEHETIDSDLEDQGSMRKEDSKIKREHEKRTSLVEFSQVKREKRSSKIEFADVESIFAEQRRHRPLSSHGVTTLEDERMVMPSRAVSMEKDDATCAMVTAGIKKNSFCRHLEDGHINRIIAAMTYAVFHVDETICKEGAIGYYFMIVHRGELEVSVNGNRINTLSSGAAFGAIALLHQCPRTATVKTVTESALWIVDRQTFQIILMEHSQQRATQNRKFLDSISIFSGLSSRMKARIGELALYEKFFGKGARVVYEGEENSAVFFVKRGKLSKVVGGSVDSNGTIQDATLVASLAIGDSFGTSSLRTGEDKRRTSVVADEDSELVCISTSQLKEVLGDNLVDILEQSVILTILKRLKFLKGFSHSQIREVMNFMVRESFERFSSIDRELNLIVVLDGETNGMRGSQDISLKRGESCEEDISRNELVVQRQRKTIATRVSKSQRLSVMDLSMSEAMSMMHSDNRQSAQRRQMDRRKTGCSGVFGRTLSKARGLHMFRAGARGCRLAMLTNEGFTEAMESLGLLEIGDESAGQKDLMKRVFMTNQVPLFRNLPSEQINHLVASLSLNCYRKDATVCVQGDIGRKAFIIAAGELRVVIDGTVVRTWGPGTCLGERALLFDEPRSATLEVASGTAEVWSMDQGDFKKILSPSMHEELIHRAQLHALFSDPDFSLKCLKHVKLIGKGAFGSVRLVEHHQTGLRYALKRIRKEDADLQDIEREVALLTDVDHPFSVKLVKTFDAQHSMYILTELITGGQLWAVLEHGCLSRKDAQFYIASLALVLEALHERNIAFRDIKPENIMLDQHGYVKLVDYGIAKKLEEDESRTYTIVGTLYYMAPELLQGLGYGLDVDIWSLGVVFYELVCGAIPFGKGAADQQEVVSAILNQELEFPEEYADSAGKKLMQGMLSKRPEKRLGTGVNGWNDITCHRFFKLETPPNFFAKILGRDIQPPFVPPAEILSRASILEDEFSDAEDLKTQRFGNAEDVSAKRADNDPKACDSVALQLGEIVETDTTYRSTADSVGVNETCAQHESDVHSSDMKILPPSEPMPDVFRRSYQATSPEPGKVASKLREEVVHARAEQA